MSDHPNPAPPAPGEDPVRPHVFDGISEYDKRLPNWWLATLYGSIIFAVFYWMVTQQFRRINDGERVTAAVQEIRAAKLSSAGAFDDSALLEMSHTASVLASGAATYQTTCISCHGPELKGGIGANLVDATWLHGNKPTDLLRVLNEGVLAKGMPAWAPVLGPKKTAEVVAFVLSKQPAP